MDNVQLLNYALKRRNFLVAVWLTLQQRWFVRSFNNSARVISWLVIALGMALVTFTVVTISRNVVPVLTTPRTLPYYALQLLVLLVSFNIYVNYLCATAFSRRIGKAPADYVYRDPFAADPTAEPSDDSEMSDSSEAEEADRRGAGQARERPAGSASSQQQPRGFSPIPASLQSRQTAGGAPDGAFAPLANGNSAVNAAASPAAPPAAAAARFAGIQVVRVFGGEESHGDTGAGSATATAAAHHSPNVGAAPAPGAPSPFVSAVPLHVDATMDMESDEDAANRVRSSSGSNGRGSAAVFASTRGLRRRWCICPLWLSRLLRLLLRSLSSTSVWRRCSAVAAAGLPWLQDCTAPADASMDAIHELERLAHTAEKCNARQRAFRVLDAPRRYCSHCRRLKAPREHHCAICNECVCKMDHHCPWINNCVDVENERYFLLFIFWLWAGTFLASAFIGYGVARQQSFVRQYQRLQKAWLSAGSSSNRAAVEAEVRALQAPYGAAGVLLTAFPTVLVLGITVTMFICMTLFLYMNRRLVLENSTVIESLLVDEKRRRAFHNSSYLYQCPYNLGAWWNFLDAFSPAGDPVVAKVLAAEQLEHLAQRQQLQQRSMGEHSTAAVVAAFEGADGGAGGAAALPAADNTAASPPRAPLLPPWVKKTVRRAAVLVWLAGFPTFRPSHCDGVHFSTFDALASGEQASLLMS